MLLDKKSKILLSIERAANDLRKGFPVIITDGKKRLLALSPETVSKEILNSVFDITISSLSLILTANRLNFIKNSKSTNDASAIKITRDQIENIPALCGIEEHSAAIPQHEAAGELEKDALQLVRIAELIPCAITLNLPETFNDVDIIYIPAEYINEYQNLVSYQLQEACRTKLVLKQSINSEIIAYRPNIGGKEHYAIVIGSDLPEVPLVRVHSSCYTGDLLESLACDCHDQLHAAIDLMHKTGGGIILYMLQEGRGIGLINKLRAYALKEKGFDTVDANEALGFDDDERLFLPAAQILKELGINKIRLLTNNPKKALGLEECEITVTECVSHIMESNEHNEQYLKTKSDRLGHTNIKPTSKP
jgi:GTP cyclohydrolase II